MPKNNIKCYIYTRVSTAIQVDGYSLDAQKDKLRKYADYQNMEIAGEYSDEGASGKNIAERPEFMRMMSDIEDSKDGISYVLVFKLSRFGRNAADVLSSLQRMQDHDVNLICVEDGIDSSKDAGKLMISVLSAVAEIERENIRAQTMAGREQKAREGRWNGGFAPYGYKLVDGELQIAEDEVDIIRIIFDQYVNKGKGTIAIARYLNDQGYVKKLRQNNSINGFSEVFVRKVLANPVYAGKIAYGRRRTEKKPGTHNEMHIVAQEEYPVYEGKHEAIISEDVWKMAEERRKKKAAMRAPKTNCRVAIISGILKCPCCGKGMYSNTSKPHSKDNKERHYYYCKNNSNATGHRCEFRQNIENSKLEKEVVYVITNLVKNPVFVDAIKAKIGESIDTTELEKKLKTLEGKLRQAEAIKNRLEKQMDELPYDDAMFERKMSDLQRRYDKQYDTMQEVENDIEEVKMQLMSIRQNQLTEENIYNVLLAFDDLYDTFDPVEKKQFFKSFIERIEIYPQKREDGTYLKKLVFNFPIPSFNGGTGKEISLEYSDTLETVVLLWRKADQADRHIVVNYET